MNNERNFAGKTINGYKYFNADNNFNKMILALIKM